LFSAKRQTDGQADIKELTVAFRNFVNVPKNVLLKKNKVL